MRLVVAIIVVLLITLAALLVGGPRSSHRDKALEHVISTCKTDLDLDGTQETIAITYTAVRGGHPTGGQVIVSQQAEDGPRVIERRKGLNPWKLRIADVDGDGKREITLGVWKKSPKDPVVAKRVFVYGWDGKQMTPKWLGSRLSRRFENFSFRDINADGWDELLALEVAPDRPKRIGIYRWKSFGFEWLSSAEPTKWEELTQ